MDAFRHKIALFGALSICALAAACSPQNEPAGYASNEVLPDLQSRSEQLQPTETPVGPAGFLETGQRSTFVQDSTDSVGSTGALLDVSEPTPVASDSDQPSTPQADIDALVPAEAPLLFGPEDGGILHDPSDSPSMRKLVGADTADAVLSADFTNPFNPDRRPFDHGFLLRVSGDRFHAVVLTSEGDWGHYISDGDGLVLLETGEAESANLERGGTNSLAVIASGRTGWFFINGLLAATIDLSDILKPGDAGAVANVVSPTQVFGAQTIYEALTVGELEAIDVQDSGLLVHDGAGHAVSETVASASSLLAEVDFEVPYAASEGDWSFGFLLDCEDGSQYRLAFNDRALWRMISTPADPELESEASFGPTPTSLFDPGKTNHLVLARLQGEWRVFLNGGFLTTIDIPDEALPVSLSLVAGVERGEQEPGFESAYSGLHAWALAY